METYQELKAKHKQKLNNFEGIFFAFSQTQFDEGMKKIGLSSDEKEKILSLGGGGFILKTRRENFYNMFKIFRTEMQKALKDDAFLLDALAYELYNYKYCITGNINDALDVLSLNFTDVPEHIMQLTKTLAGDKN